LPTSPTVTAISSCPCAFETANAPEIMFQKVLFGGLHSFCNPGSTISSNIK
jgi:hypothetical protein